MCVDVILVDLWLLSVLTYRSHLLLPTTSPMSTCPADRHTFAPSPREANMPLQMLLVLQGPALCEVESSTAW